MTLFQCLSVGVEVSAMAPFKTRSTQNGLLACLPEHLRAKFLSIFDRQSASVSSQIQTFWMTTDDIPMHQDKKDRVHTFILGKPKMIVKKKLYSQDSEVIILHLLK